MKFCLLFVIWVCADIAFAQKVDSVSLEQVINNANRSSYQPTDPSDLQKEKNYAAERVEVKKFDSKKWKEIIGNEDYSENAHYRKNKNQNLRYDSASETDGKRWMQDDYDDREDASTSIAIDPVILKIIFYAFTFGVIGYILFLIIKNTSLKSKGKISKEQVPDGSAMITDIRELEVDRLLREAIASGNFRLAIRIYFLGLLKKLDEDGFIAWKNDKTNRDYLSELFSKKYYFEEVRSLTLVYEQVWYGDHSFSNQAYEKIISSFQEINQKLNEPKPE